MPSVSIICEDEVVNHGIESILMFRDSSGYHIDDSKKPYPSMINTYKYQDATKRLSDISKQSDILIFHSDFFFYTSLENLLNIKTLKVCYLPNYNKSLLYSLKAIKVNAIIDGDSSVGALRTLIYKIGKNIRKSHRQFAPKENTDFFDYYSSLPRNKRSLLKMISEGKTNKEISNTVNLSVGSVKNYLTTVYYKFHLKNRSEAALFLANNIASYEKQESLITSISGKLMSEL